MSIFLSKRAPSGFQIGAGRPMPGPYLDYTPESVSKWRRPSVEYDFMHNVVAPAFGLEGFGLGALASPSTLTAARSYADAALPIARAYVPPMADATRVAARSAAIAAYEEARRIAVHELAQPSHTAASIAGALQGATVALRAADAAFDVAKGRTAPIVRPPPPPYVGPVVPVVPVGPVEPVGPIGPIGPVPAGITLKSPLVLGILGVVGVIIYAAVTRKKPATNPRRRRRARRRRR